MVVVDHSFSLIEGCLSALSDVIGGAVTRRSTGTQAELLPDTLRDPNDQPTFDGSTYRFAFDARAKTAALPSIAVSWISFTAECKLDDN